MERVRRSVSCALALVHAALEEMTDASLAAAKMHAADLLPELQRLGKRGTLSSELLVELGQLNAMLSLLRQRLDGTSRPRN
jgi:hypothetical protein